jgi:hypothetical protein
MLVRTSHSGYIEPCLPSPADKPPSGPDWVHEIKHDGYRLMARRDPVGIRLLTRNGYDWAPRYPLIVAAVNALKVRSCLIDGEAIACDDNGLSVFELLREKPARRNRVLAARAFGGLLFCEAYRSLTAGALPHRPAVKRGVEEVGAGSGELTGMDATKFALIATIVVVGFLLR